MTTKRHERAWMQTPHNKRTSFRTSNGSVVFGHGDEPDRLVGHRPRPRQDDFYRVLYSETSGACHETRRHQFATLGRHAATICESPRGPLVWLDVGCGSGAFVHFLRDAFAPDKLTPYGADPAAPPGPGLFAVPLAHVSTHHASLPKRFDVISLLDVLEHFEDCDAALAEIRNLLADNGQLIIKVPNRGATVYVATKLVRLLFPWFARRIFDRLYQVHYPPPHYAYFDFASLEATLRRCRYRPVATEYVSEIPWRHVWSRLWGMPGWLRILALPALIAIKLVSTPSGRESLLFVAEKMPES